MNTDHFSYDTSSGKMAVFFSNTKDSLGVIHTNSIWESKKKQLVLIIETNQMISDDIEVMLYDNRITIEAPIVLSYDNPLNRDNQGQHKRINIDGELTVIGFYTTKLKPDYKYTYISSKTIDSNLIKVILEYKDLIKSCDN